jgi:lipase
MRLHVHEWGEPDAPSLVCLHGVTAHGRRFRRLAEERLAARFRVLAPDLRGHGRSGWEPPWRLDTFAGDLLETLKELGIGRAVLLGHSFGGRLVLELVARVPTLAERVVLLDPAIQIPPHVALERAEDARTERAYASVEDAVRDRIANDPTNPRRDVEEEMREHLVAGEDGLLRPRVSQACVVAVYAELASEPPPPEILRMPTLLVYSPAFRLVREDQLARYRDTLGETLTVTAVEGGHMVYWDAFDATAATLDEFLATPATPPPATPPPAAPKPV